MHDMISLHKARQNLTDFESRPATGMTTMQIGVLLCLQLVEVINEDYADFVSLSTQLINVDGAVARMQKPLGDLKVCLPLRSRGPCTSDAPSARDGQRHAIQTWKWNPTAASPMFRSLN